MAGEICPVLFQTLPWYVRIVQQQRCTHNPCKKYEYQCEHERKTLDMYKEVGTMMRRGEQNKCHALEGGRRGRIFALSSGDDGSMCCHRCTGLYRIYKDRRAWSVSFYRTGPSNRTAVYRYLVRCEEDVGTLLWRAMCADKYCRRRHLHPPWSMIRVMYTQWGTCCATVSCSVSCWSELCTVRAYDLQK